MFAIVRYRMESIDSDVELDIVEVCSKEGDATEYLTMTVEDDFNGVNLYDEVEGKWEWDMEDVKDEELKDQLDEHYLFYHIKICEV